MAVSESHDVVIVGGGVIGSAVAHFLTTSPDFNGSVLMIERDPTYAYASTALSAASIRTQFSNAINIEISRFGLDFIRNFSDLDGGSGKCADLAFKENGYLFLAASEGQQKVLEENNRVQHKCGVDTILLSPYQLKERFPHLNTDDLLLGSLGLSGDGWFDNMGLLHGLIASAREHGARYAKADVTSVQCHANRVASVTLSSGERITCDRLVNAAGPRAAQVAQMAGIALPVEARKRTNFLFSCQSPPEGRLPLMIDPTGVFCRPEGEHFLTGCTPDPDPAVDFEDFEPRYAEFEDIIWPALAARSPNFEAIRFERGWAGHYAYNTLDQNAVIGPHPELKNFIFANGFSGHGLQQAPAVGRAIAEWISVGRYQTINMEPLAFERIVHGKPFIEKAII